MSVWRIGRRRLPRHGSLTLWKADRTCHVLAYNSLSNSIEPLEIHPASSNNPKSYAGAGKWYACGPTVYDSAHIGHARTYVSQDIIRRILEKRFGYHYVFAMGVTDIDDKIIQRAKERGIHYLDLARMEEARFFHQMDRLRVKRPHIITRVSEHMREILQYIQGIQDNGFAYQAKDGSGLYFDTESFGERYGKLDPALRSRALGRACCGDVHADGPADNLGKKDKKDFALWKAIRDTNTVELEPSWSSPWGQGRPGWHIECSAMIHQVLGENIDVHSGGIDLKFPHHNNEIAQSEAFNLQTQIKKTLNADKEWCKHFIHFGHLYIEGRKMSKSLKNFITIEDLLKEYSPDQFRVFCLQYKYRANIHYSPDRMRDAMVVIAKLRNFLSNLQSMSEIVNQTIRHREECKKYDQADFEIMTTLFRTKCEVDLCLHNDFDTPEALIHILALVSRANEYLLTRKEHSPREVRLSLATYLLETLGLFGMQDIVAEFAHLEKRILAQDDILTGNVPQTKAHTQFEDFDDLIQCIIQFRSEVRSHLLQKKSSADTLALCDRFRDHTLPALGIYLKDLDCGKTTVTLKEKRFCINLEEESKDSVKKLLQEKRSSHVQLMQILPHNLFKESPAYKGKYSKFDIEGIPTHETGNEAPISKSQRKKLQIKMKKHALAYEKFRNP